MSDLFPSDEGFLSLGPVAKAAKTDESGALPFDSLDADGARAARVTRARLVRARLGETVFVVAP